MSVHKEGTNVPGAGTKRGAPKYVRLWLDDIRPMPEGFTHWCERAETAMNIVATGTVGHISFDHDLGPKTDATGYAVAAFIEDAVIRGLIDMPTWEVHSMNPAGAERIREAMRSAERASFVTDSDPGDEQP